MKTYLFDFDGTLVDSMPSFCACMLRILDDYHITYEADIIKTITPLGLLGTAEYFVRLGVPLSVEEIGHLMGKYLLDAYEHRIPAKKNVEKTLRALKEQGASLNILTASPHISLNPCLKRLGLWDLFDTVWSCDDFVTTKADPAIYSMAAERLGLSVKAVWFLDDNLVNCRAAKAAGMQVCGVYDASSAEFVEEIKAVADRYIYDFTELLEQE